MWYSPAGSRAPQEIAEAFSSYLVRGLQRQPSVDAILPLAEAGASA